MPDQAPTHPGRYACIDCGTNSVKLIVADLTHGWSAPVLQLSDTTRIGEGMHANEMRLQTEPVRRTLEAIGRFATAARECGAIETALVGTAALRDAASSTEFTDAVRERSGLELDIIAGAEEARLSFLAVRLDPYWRSVPQLLVIDVGGGSTELILGAPGETRVLERTSVNVGAVKLTERFLPSDPPTPDQVAAAIAAAEAAFKAAPFTESAARGSIVVGVGGTLTNLAAMRQGANPEPEAIHGLALSELDIEALIASLAEKSIAERREMPGLDPSRADIILAGAILLRGALAHVDSQVVGVCTRGLRWGVLYDRFLPRVAGS
ncbi:MAG TPA: hypothetical protein VKT77_10225 [Chthonomonadaceae bacterium]|nr:hypothetical protein [Chthonomonadaceae bacterium]